MAGSRSWSAVPPGSPRFSSCLRSNAASPCPRPNGGSTMRRRSGIGLGFTDLLFNALLGFVVMFVLAYLMINPIARTGAVDPKAEFLITLTWPDGRPEDVDLYVEDPAANLVWFRQREAGLMHLDRDDLGQRNDFIEVAGRRIVNPLNQETVSIRGIVPGEFVVNVHLYRAHDGSELPATVKVEKLNPKVDLVFYGSVSLREQGDERTAVRFAIGADGRVRVPPPGFFVVASLAVGALLGRPTEWGPPAQFQLHAALVLEPNRGAGSAGAIYLWLSPRDTEGNVTGPPRAHALPYSRALHEQTARAQARLQDGRPVEGTAEPAPPLRHPSVQVRLFDAPSPI